jgi:hypothetical protein
LTDPRIRKLNSIIRSFLAGGQSIHVNPRQNGNPLLKHIRNVPHEFVQGLVPDYGTSVMMMVGVIMMVVVVVVMM